MKAFCLGFSLCLLLAMGVNTTYAQNTVDLVPIINKCHAEGYGFVSSQQTFSRLGIVQTRRDLPSALGLSKTLDSLQAVYLRNVPCNTDRDTIYVIEYYSIWDGGVINMYWSHRFRYSCVNGHEKDTIYIERDEEYDVDIYRSEWDEVVEWYDTNIFVESMISQVERWDKEAMMAQQVKGWTENVIDYTIIRIIYDMGKVRTESFELVNYEDADRNGGLILNIDSLRQSPNHIKTFRQHHTNKS